MWASLKWIGGCYRVSGREQDIARSRQRDQHSCPSIRYNKTSFVCCSSVRRQFGRNVLLCYVCSVAVLTNIKRDLRRALVSSSQYKCHPLAVSTSGRPPGGGSAVRLIALVPPIPSACSFSCTRRTISGSGSGSTFLGATRGQSLHFSCPQS